MLEGLFIKKSIGQIHDECGRSELKRTLSAWNLISLGIGCIIGAGIFVMTGQQAAQYAGPAIMISFVLAGVTCALAALCYAELASALPVSGSAYTYAYATLGELLAWVMGWLLLLEYGVSASTVAVGWSGYFVSLMKDYGVIIPDALAQPTLQYVTTSVNAAGDEVKGLVFTHNFNLPAFGSVVLLTGLLILGIKESANIAVLIKATVLILFIIAGVWHVDPANWQPFIPEYVYDLSLGVERFGWPGILHAAAVISFAYVGFEAVSTAAQEAKNPKRDIPIGILGSLGICTVLYILVAAVLTGVVPYTQLNVADPIAVAVDALNQPWLKWCVKIGAVIGLFSVMLVLLYGQTRIFYAMARDGLLPEFFGTIHKKFCTPYINTLIVGLVTGLIAGFTPIDILADLVSLGTLMAFGIICFSVLYLRYKEPGLERAFKVPFFPVTPILGVLACGYLMWGIKGMLITLKYYLLAGLLIYLLYGWRNSRLQKSRKIS